MKRLQKTKLAQIYYYEPQSAGKNVRSLQSESTLRRLTLVVLQEIPPLLFIDRDYYGHLLAH